MPMVQVPAVGDKSPVLNLQHWQDNLHLSLSSSAVDLIDTSNINRRSHSMWIFLSQLDESFLMMTATTELPAQLPAARTSGQRSKISQDCFHLRCGSKWTTFHFIYRILWPYLKRRFTMGGATSFGLSAWYLGCLMTDLKNLKCSDTVPSCTTQN